MHQLHAAVSRKKAVITGAAQGLGQALAQRLSAEGAQVAVGDMNLEGVKKTVAMLTNGTALAVDVTCYDSCEKFIGDAVRVLGGIDILVSNAAILISGAIAGIRRERSANDAGGADIREAECSGH